MKLNVFNKPDENWGRPDRWSGNRIHELDSCWDCEHLQLGSYPNRRCKLFPDIFIESVGPIEEKEITGSINAKSCGHFCLAKELDPNWDISDDELEELMDMKPEPDEAEYSPEGWEYYND